MYSNIPIFVYIFQYSNILLILLLSRQAVVILSHATAVTRLEGNCSNLVFTQYMHAQCSHAYLQKLYANCNCIESGYGNIQLPWLEKGENIIIAMPGSEEKIYSKNTVSLFFA